MDWRYPTGVVQLSLSNLISLENRELGIWRLGLGKS
jgi:hypothetical protein